MRKLRNCLIALVVLGLIGGIGFTAYVNDYYKAISKTSSPNVLVDYGTDIVIRPVDNDKQIGFAFYPGAKVASDAYIELLAPLAEQGYTVVIAQMPFHLAVLNANRMNSIIENHPEVDTWYLGGHSLGGAMAGKYVASHQDAVAGLFLLAAYVTSDLSDYEGPVLSLYGDSDRVLAMSNYESNKSNLPSDAQFDVIVGGNHAGFGSYGAQGGDGIGKIKGEEQQKQTREALLSLVLKPQP